MLYDSSDLSLFYLIYVTNFYVNLPGEIQQLCEEYKNANDDEKLKLEKRYGRKVLVNAIEESQSEAWLENNTKSCPSCHAKIEVQCIFILHLLFI